MVLKRYETIETFSSDRDYFGCPAKVDKYAILRDNAQNRYVLQVKLQNLTTVKIDYLLLKVTGKTEAGEAFETEESYGMLDSYSEFFGSDRVIVLATDKVMSVDVRIDKVILSGDTEWTYNGWVTLVAQKELPSAFKKELSASKSLDIRYFKYYPCREESFWQCSCGKANNKEVCSLCGQSQNDIFEETNPKKLIEALGVRLKESVELAEKEKEEQEKFREKTKSVLKRIIIVMAAVFAACLLFWTVNKVYYTTAYSNAVKAFEKQNYSVAVKKFNELPQKVYQDRICDLIKRKNEEIQKLYESKKISYDDATNALTELKKYENIDRVSEYDSKKEKRVYFIDETLKKMKSMNDSRTEFSKGKELVKSKKYKEAVKVFEKIKDGDENYHEAQREIAECKLTITKDVEEKLKKYKEEKNYSSALSLFEKNNGYIIKNDEIKNLESYFNVLKKGEELVKEGKIIFTSQTNLYNDIDGDSEYYIDASYYNSKEGEVLEYQITDKNVLWVKVDVGEVFWVKR